MAPAAAAAVVTFVEGSASIEELPGPEAEAPLTKAYQQASREKAGTKSLAIGLLLADLQQRRGQIPAADTLYKQLTAAHPEDPRPLLGQAMLRQQQGKTREALELLERARRLKPNQPDTRLDDVAAAWGLEPLRRGKGAKTPQDAIKEPPGRRDP